MAASSRRQDVLGALAFLGLGVLAWLFSARFPAGAQVFPRIAASLIVASAVVWLGRALLASADRRATVPFVAQPARLAVAVGGTFLYTLGVIAVGYIAATVIFVPVLAFVLGFRGMLVTVPVATGFTLAVYLVFEVIFRRPLPALPAWL